MAWRILIATVGLAAIAFFGIDMLTSDSAPSPVETISLDVPEEEGQDARDKSANGSPGDDRSKDTKGNDDKRNGQDKGGSGTSAGSGGGSGSDDGAGSTSGGAGGGGGGDDDDDDDDDGSGDEDEDDDGPGDD